MESLDNLYARTSLHVEPVSTKPVRIETKPPVSLVGRYLREIIEREVDSTIPCGACKNEIQRLNGMTTEAVRAESSTIAEAIFERAKTQPKKWYQALAIRLLPGVALSIIQGWIEEACQKEDREPYGKPVENPTKTDGRNWPEILPVDLTDSVRHLIYHLWPVPGVGMWQWNLEQLAARWSLFNGSKIISIATDANTDSVADVIEFCRLRGVIWDTVISGPNNGLGEVAFWQQKIAALPPAESNHLVFYAHGKGVQSRTATDAVRLWTQLMIEANLDYWPAVRDILQTKLFCGSLRFLGLYRLPGNFRWHYSGTFFWFRWHDIQARHPETVYKQYIGTEAWPGDKCRRDESGVLFMDEMKHSLYDLPTMQGVVWPQWDAWKRQNHHQRTEDAMCSTWGVNFARYLPAGSVKGNRVIEIGARDINGSCRPMVMQQGPVSYTSTDMDSGPGVDIVCAGQDLPGRLGTEVADVLICTEVLEHVKDWDEFIQSIWSLLPVGGVLLLTTRSPGFPYHEYPCDHWRFTFEDMAAIFGSQEICTLTKDPTSDPGVGIIVRKRSNLLWCELANPMAMERPQ